MQLSAPARGPRGWKRGIATVALTPRPCLIARRPPLAAVAQLACGRVTVQRAPAQPHDILPSRHQRGSLMASPSLRPRPTAWRPPLAMEAGLARDHVVPPVCTAS